MDRGWEMAPRSHVPFFKDREDKQSSSPLTSTSGRGTNTGRGEERGRAEQGTCSL